MTPYERVLKNPRSIVARRDLLAAWHRESDPRAELLDLELGSYLAEPGGNGIELGGKAERLIEDHGRMLAGPIAKLVSGFSFEMGLVGYIQVTAADLVANARDYFDAAPLLGLGISDPDGARAVVDVAQLSQILVLNVFGRGIDDELALAISRSQYLGEVRDLCLADGTITREGLAAITSSANLPNLISLDVTNNPCADAVNEIEGRHYWIGRGGGPFWAKAHDDRLASSASWMTPTFTWPPVFDSYAWID